MRKLSLIVVLATIVLSVTNTYIAYAKATATVFYSEPFDTGIPAGWTTGAFAGPTASWKWYVQGQVSQSTSPIAAINTATGFMIYDADSINQLPPVNSAAGWLRSGSISCSGHSYVSVRFNQTYRRYVEDSCFLDVSINNFATYTRYSLDENNYTHPISYLPSNPYNTQVNISGVAANQANVQIRFSYYSHSQGFSWQIDDVELVDPDPVDVALHKSFSYKGVGTHLNTLPIQLADSVGIVGYLDNLGYTAPSNVTVNAKIFRNATQVYSQDYTFTTLLINEVDTYAMFPVYTPTVTGDYTVALSLSLPGNVNTHTTDTTYFTIVDTIFSPNSNHQAPMMSSFYLHKPAPDEKSYAVGAHFTIDNAVSDTVTALSIAFKSTTTPGTNIAMQLYKWDDVVLDWNLYGITYSHNLDPAEISSLATVVHAYFPIDTSSGIVIMDEGRYVAVAVTINAPANAEVSALLSGRGTPFSGAVGALDTSYNDGNFSFAMPSYSLDSIPMVKVHMGNYSNVPTGSSVWPGDVNDDLIANNNDALDILLGWGNTGVTRPSASNSWTGQPCIDWGTFVLPTVDMKNADCDGNGTVGYSDTVAIWNNYGQIHLKGEHIAQAKASGIPELYFDLAAVTFTAGTTVHIPIKFGTAASPMNNIMGLAAQIKIGGISLTTAPRVTLGTSWMGTAGNLLNFKKGVSTNQTDWTLGRINHTNVSGNGTIATLDVDIPNNATGQVIFYFDNVRVIDNAGNVISGYNVLDDTATIITTAINNIENPAHQIAILPNPSSSQTAVQVYLDAPATLHITITDVVGKTVYDMVKTGKQGLQQFELPTTSLMPGIYTVKLSSDTWQGETIKWLKN